MTMANLLATSAMLVVLWGCAHGIMRLWSTCVGRPDPACSCAVLQLCGLGGVSLAGFAVCALGFRPVPRPLFVEDMQAQPYLAVTFVGCGVLGCLLGVRDLSSMLTVRALHKVPWAAWITVAGLACLAPWTLMPPFLVDESLYHLTFPLQYLLHGGFVIIEGHGNSSFPAFAEMITFWPLSCGAMSAARAVELLVFVLGARALVRLLSDVPASATCWGILLMMATPSVCCLLPSSHIDIAQSVYALVGILCLVRYDTTRSRTFLYAGAWLVGCAAACKYLALAVIPFAGLVWLFSMRRWQRAGEQLPGMWECAGAACLMVAPVLPWLARNGWLFGNPLFPFASDWFSSGDHALAVQQVNTLDYFLRQFGPADGNTQLFGWRAMYRLPIDLFFAARFDRLQFDGSIGPLAYSVLLTWLLARKAPPRPTLPPVVGWYSLYMLLVWLSTSWQMRFLVSAYWVVALAAPVFWLRLRGRLVRAAMAMLMAASVVWVAPDIARKLPPLDADMLGDARSRHALRLRAIPASAVCDALNAATAARSLPTKAMLVWTQRLALWCTTDLLSESYDEAASFNAWLLEPEVTTTLTRLREHGITHLLIDEAAFYEMPPGGVGAAEDRDLQHIFTRYKVLQRDHLQLLSRQTSVALYALR